MGFCWAFSGTSKSNEVRSGRDDGNSANQMSILRKRDVDFPNGKILPTPHLKIFTLSELKSATSNFRPHNITGNGEFGTVFKGWLDEVTLAPAKPGSGMVTAIEKLNPKSKRGIQEWQSEIEFLGRLSHPNLVKLLGYCLDEKEVLLVYEFMAEGSLKHLLWKVSQPLAWSKRLKILIGAARGLAFLHISDKQVMCRNFNASNIWLDSKYHAKLSDCGYSKEFVTNLRASPEPSPCGGRVIGTYGFPPPEDVATGDLYWKSDDVYGFGGVLVEMLTGRHSYYPSGQQNLVMDKRLKGQYHPEAALKAAQLSLKCLDDDPRSRPSMKEVVDALEQIEAITHKRKTAAPPAKRKTDAPPPKPSAAKPRTAAPPAKRKTDAPPPKPRAAKPRTAAPPAKRKTDAPPAKRKTDAPPAKRKTDAPPAKRKTAASPAKRETAAPPAKPRTAAPPAKRKTDAPPAKRKTDAPPAKRKTDAPPAKRKTDAPPAKRKTDAPPAKRKTAASPAKRETDSRSPCQA